VKGVVATGVAHVVGAGGTPVGAEAPPETPTLRVVRRMDGALCIAPQYVAEDLLRLEGFADLRYVETKAGSPFIERALASGEADISLHYVPSMIVSLDAGDPILFLAGDTSAATSCSHGRAFGRSGSSRGGSWPCRSSAPPRRLTS